MIEKLQKKLTFIFIISIMLLFTAAFYVIIKKDIANAKESEYEYFRKITANMLLNFDIDASVNDYFSIYEKEEPIAFQMEDDKNNIVYQTDLSDYADLNAIVNILKKEKEKEVTASLIDTKVLPSGIFTYNVQGRSYMGIYCDLTDFNGTRYILYTVKQDTSLTDFAQKNTTIYFLMWTAMLVVTIIISSILIKKALTPTEIAVQSTKNFIASASHELKAPLAVIMTNAEAAASDPKLDRHLMHHLNIIDSEVSRMSELVQDLLLLSSIDANTWQLKKESTDICTLMLTVYEKYEPLCNKKNIKLELDIKDDVFPEFIADSSRLEQIIGIFLDNAIYYSNTGTSINLTVNSEQKRIIFTIQDHGIGIDESNKMFIYDRFYQSDKSRTNTNHYGLGLSIAKELVEMHKGKIELLDTPGGGCTFKIYFPITK